MQIVNKYTAEGAITKFRFVKFGSTDSQVIQASAVTDRIVGVYIGPSDAANTDSVLICELGECFLEVDGAIGRGMTLTTDANGKGVNAAPAAGTNNKAGARAQISGTSTTIRVLVVPGWFQG